MPELQWEQEYNELLKYHQKNGEFEAFGIHQERRIRPRFQLKSGYVWIKVQPRFTVVDVSISGIAIHSDFPFKKADIIHITLGKAFSIEAKVRNSEIVVSDESLLEHKYLVRCSFEDDSVGMQFLVMIKEMDNLEVNLDATVNMETR